jgi:hypothetical protein
VRKDTISTMSDGTTTQILCFFSKYIIILYSTLEYYHTLYLVLSRVEYELLAATNDNLTMVLPPPLSEIMSKHDEALGGIGKNLSADIWCQCALI